MSDHVLMPLALAMYGCATQEEMNTNVAATLKRRYWPAEKLFGKLSGTVSIVGSGPSLRDTLPELTGDILAINQAIGFLLERGIVPKFAMLWDAADVVSQFAVPNAGTVYLVASRCHASVFERLKDCRVFVWHAGGDHNIYEFLAHNNVPESLVNGGSAGITRAMFLAVALGYTDLQLFGADSSYGEDGNTHIVRSLVPEKDLMISVGNDPEKWFRTTPEWCAQVHEYRSIYAQFTHAGLININVHGSGMLPYMHSILAGQRAQLGADSFLRKMMQHDLQRAALDNAALAASTN